MWMNESGLSSYEPTLGRRRESRLRVRLQVRLITLDGTTRLAMADVSRRGARLAGSLPRLRVGQQGVIQWGPFEAFGQVAWCNERGCGLIFDEPLAQHVLFSTRQIHDSAKLRSEREVARGVAEEFVQGKVRL